MPTYDAIVIGLGGIGSAAAYQLARRGVRVLGLDRFPAGHDRGSSHGQSRMIRQAYFEHPDYVPLVCRAYEGWRELEQRARQTLLNLCGVLQMGSPTGEVVPGVLAAAREHDLTVETLTHGEVARRFPGFFVPDDAVAVFEPAAGFLPVETCVRTHLEEAARLGADLRCDLSVRGWSAAQGSVTVETDRETYLAASLVIAAGPWAGELLAPLGLPLVVRRKPLYWYAPADDTYRLERGCPGFLYETAAGVFYGFPQLGPEGLKIAEHTGGQEVDDPLGLDRSLDRHDQQRVEAFIEAYLPRVTGACTQHAVCMYTLTPDHHFVVDRHPAHANVALVAGLSGHGFKFAPVLGQALADLALEGQTALPIAFLSCARPWR